MRLELDQPILASLLLQIRNRNHQSCTTFCNRSWLTGNSEPKRTIVNFLLADGSPTDALWFANSQRLSYDPSRIYDQARFQEVPMRPLLFRLLLALFSFTSIIAAQTLPSVAHQASTAPIYIIHVTVIDTVVGRELPDRIVVISGDHISEV